MELYQIPLFQMLAFCKIRTEVKLSCQFNYFLEVVTPFLSIQNCVATLYKVMTLKKIYVKKLLWPFFTLAGSVRLVTVVFAFL